MQDETLIERLSQGQATMSSSLAERELIELFTGAQTGPRPVRRVREYEVVETLDHHETFTERQCQNGKKKEKAGPLAMLRTPYFQVAEKVS